MPSVWTTTLDTPKYKGTLKVNTGLYIGGQWVDSVKGTTIE